MKEKVKYFKELVGKYQDDDFSLKTRFIKFEEESSSTLNDKMALENAEGLSKEFTFFYKDFFNNYTFFFSEYHDINCQNKEVAKEYAEYSKVYLDSCSLNILRLNTNYIQPLTNKITINKANTSILWGKWSVGLGCASILIGLATTIFSFYISADSEKSINKINQALLNQKVISFQNTIVLNEIDSFVKTNNYNVTKLIDNLSNPSK